MNSTVKKKSTLSLIRNTMIRMKPTEVDNKTNDRWRYNMYWFEEPKKY